MLEQSRDPSRLPRPAPASYALGNARVTVQVAATEPRLSGQIRVDLAIDVLEDDWVLVPVLPAGTPVEAATIGGNPIQLLATPDGLAWSTKKSGSYNMNLLYRVDAMRSDNGFTLAVPLPQAAATQLTASLPGSGLDVAVIPAAGVKFSQSGQTTRVSATIRHDVRCADFLAHPRSERTHRQPSELFRPSGRKRRGLVRKTQRRALQRRDGDALSSAAKRHDDLAQEKWTG